MPPAPFPQSGWPFPQVPPPALPSLSAPWSGGTILVRLSCTLLQRAVTQSRLTLCKPTGCSPPGSSVCGDPPGKNTGMDCHALLQGISPTQGSNPGFPYCKWILDCLSHQGSLTISIYSLHNSLPLHLMHFIILPIYVSYCLSPQKN